MDVRCENCGQPALTNDVVCWHCGQPLPGREHAAEETIQVKESWLPGDQLYSLGFYVALTVLLIVATLIVLNSLAKRPLVQVGLSSFPANEWQVFTDTGINFTLNLPNEWEWFEGADLEQRAMMEAVFETNPHILMGVFPLGSDVEDFDFPFLAIRPVPSENLSPAFIIVGRSELLNRLTYEDAQRYLQNEDFKVIEMEFVEDFEKSHLSIFSEVATLDRDFESLLCNQQFIRGEREGLVVAACAPSNRYGSYKIAFEEVMASFQRFS